MTNGEKIKEIFPSIELYEKSHDDIQINFNSIWWNAEYKEPTRKTCKTCRNFGSHNGVCDICNPRYNDLWKEKENKSEIPTSSDNLSSGTRKNSEKLEKDFGESDCISRQSVAKYIDYIQNHGMGKKKSFEFIKKFVANLPPATPQASTTKNDLVVDCISRKAALDITWHDPSYSDPLNVLTEVRDKIRDLSSVTPIRPKGHWIKQNDDYYDWYECSECGYGSDGEMQYSSEYDVRTNYCPCCGAKMEEVEE